MKSLNYIKITDLKTLFLTFRCRFYMSYSWHQYFVHLIFLTTYVETAVQNNHIFVEI